MLCARVRATMSAGPPAEKGTTIITGLDGNSCAPAIPTIPQPSHNRINIRCIELSSQFFCSADVAAAHIDGGQSISLEKAADSAQKYAVSDNQQMNLALSDMNVTAEIFIISRRTAKIFLAQIFLCF